MKSFILYVIFGCLSIVFAAPPISNKKHIEDNNVDSKEKDSDVKENLEDYMEYHRYLKEVISALESDPEFRDKLEKAQYVDIRTGKIAHELNFVNRNIRTKLDEIKRNEVERLRHLVTKHFELTNNLDAAHAKIASQAEHLDHSNPHTFEIDDLKKLIYKTTADLEEADKKRRTDFKEYEMQKEFEKQQKLQALDESQRKEYENEIHNQEEKHKKHAPLHHPGSRQQLEEVWEKQDHMENQEFNPKTFFMLHDVDGNGVWDQTEVKALFIKELDKMYENGAPEDDMRERQEEMERMREHVFQESDTNKDGLISYEEFLVQTRRVEFEKDQGWKGLDEQVLYSPQEYQEFERNRLEEVQKLIQQGVIPPLPNFDYPNPHHVNQPPHMGYQQQMHPPQYQQHPGQPQFHQNSPPQVQQHYDPTQHNQQQYHQNMGQQGQPQYYPNAVPQPQYHPNAIPPHPAQVNQHGAPNQQIPQQNMNHQQQNMNIPPQQNINNQQQNVNKQQKNTNNPQQNVNAAPQNTPQQTSQHIESQKQAPKNNVPQPEHVKMLPSNSDAAKQTPDAKVVH